MTNSSRKSVSVPLKQMQLAWLIPKVLRVFVLGKIAVPRSLAQIIPLETRTYRTKWHKNH
jgi:hypothetical protein